MNKVLISVYIVLLALPGITHGASREKLEQYLVVEAQDLVLLEDLYDLAVIRASELNCFQKKPNISDRIRKNKRYKRYKKRRKNNDLCRIEYIRIEVAAENLDNFNDIKLSRRDANNTIFNKVALTRYAVVSDINERKERRRDLACHIESGNVGLCLVEANAINYITDKLLPVVNIQMHELWGYECRGTKPCK